MDEMIDKLLDHYRITEVLGRGGMGVVYKAVDENLHRNVALKMMKPALAQDTKFIKRFDKEARSQASLQHPNIVRIYAFRKLGDHAFIVMELIDGTNMANLVDRISPKPWHKVLDLFKQCLKGISGAHQNGVIHRDIKPRNILISSQNEVKIGDFGLAKLTNSGHTTFSENTAGTLRYMSPEQIQGSRNLDHRTDIYSLGITFYEVLVGKLPFKKGDNEYHLFKQIVEETIPAPADLNPEIPVELSRIVMKAIEKDPDKRYPNAVDMLADILAFERSQEGNETMVARPSGLQGSPKGMGIKVGAALGAVALLAGVLWFSGARGTNSVPHLRINSVPRGVEIYDKEKLIGVTPVSDFPAIFLGKKLTFRAEGYNPVDTSLQGELLEVGEFFLELVPIAAVGEKGDLRISGTDGATVKLNGALRGQTPLTLSDLEPGRYRIDVSKSGYEAKEQTVTITAGQNADLRIVLDRQVSEAPAKTPTRETNEQLSRLKRTAEQARSGAGAARQKALAAGAEKLPRFDAARIREEEGLRAFREGDYTAAGLLFDQAVSQYEGAAQNAAAQKTSTTTQPSPPAVDPARGEAESAKTLATQARIDAGNQGTFLQEYQSAEARMNGANDLFAAGNYAGARQAYGEASDLYGQTAAAFQAQDQAVRRRIEDYRLAIEAKDLDRIRTLYPTLDKTGEKSWEDFFSFANKVRVSMDIVSLQHQQGNAVALLDTRIRFQGAEENTPINRWRMGLRNTGERWVITSVHQN
ncbi:MAG: protein kinase [Calditrichaeota bacterium]|nr:protein kinase [Calditrichota bacterium]